MYLNFFKKKTGPNPRGGVWFPGGRGQGGEGGGGGFGKFRGRPSTGGVSRVLEKSSGGKIVEVGAGGCCLGFFQAAPPPHGPALWSGVI